MDNNIKEKLSLLIEPKIEFIYDENILEDEIEIDKDKYRKLIN